MVTKQNISVAAPVAPEDLVVGQYVGVLHEIEDMSYWTRCESWAHLPRTRITVPDSTEEVARVVAICLPFVLAEDADGDRKQFDVRRVRLAALPAPYGDAAFKKKDADLAAGFRNAPSASAASAVRRAVKRARRKR